MIVDHADNYLEVSAAQLVSPSSGEDNVISMHRKSAFDGTFDGGLYGAFDSAFGGATILRAAICPFNKMAGLHKMQLCRNWLQNYPGTLHVRQAINIPDFSLRNACHHIVISGFIFIL
jgi:hypothetical protein